MNFSHFFFFYFLQFEVIILNMAQYSSNIERRQTNLPNDLIVSANPNGHCASNAGGGGESRGLTTPLQLETRYRIGSACGCHRQQNKEQHTITLYFALFEVQFGTKCPMMAQ